MAKDHHYALVVGINYYPGFSDLRCPVSDANEFYDWLTQDAGVPPGNIQRILGDADAPDALSATPTADQIQRAVRRIHQQAKGSWDADLDRWQESRLYIFLSGHGIAPTGQEAALLMADADADAMPHLPCQKYLEYYIRNQYFREVVILADCCRTAKPVEIVGPPFTPAFQGIGTVSSFTGFATGDDTAAFEPPSNAIAPSASSHSYFTEALLEALRGVNVAESGAAVTNTTVRDYLYKVVPERSNQSPQIVTDPTSEIVFRPPTPAPPPAGFEIVIHPNAGHAGEIELWHGDRLIATWKTADGDWQLTVSAGLYEVRPKGAVDGSGFANDGLFKVSKGGQHVAL